VAAAPPPPTASSSSASPSSPPSELLDVAHLSVSIRSAAGTVTIVDDVSLSVREREVLCVVGESGSGKSVTMLAIMQLLDPDLVDYEGTVRLSGSDLLALPPARMQQVRGRDLAMIFQDPMTALNPVYPVGFQIAEQIRAHSDVSRDAARRQTRDLLVAVGIPDPDRRLDAYPHELSGGMRQRVMIAMALSCRPGLLIADEPTTALDVTIQAQILRLISTLSSESGMAVVLVTHDMGVVAEMADRVQVMYGGRVVEEGSADEVLDHAQHPYTQGLLASIPRLDRPRPRRLPSIAGTPAVAGQVGSGCVFAGRCAYRFEPCGVQPALVEVPGQGRADPGDARPHRAACHLTAPAAERP
jgi:peptide/nickel transport system ATP-binding protein